MMPLIEKQERRKFHRKKKKRKVFLLFFPLMLPSDLTFLSSSQVFFSRKEGRSSFTETFAHSIQSQREVFYYYFAPPKTPSFSSLLSIEQLTSSDCDCLRHLLFSQYISLSYTRQQHDVIRVSAGIPFLPLTPVFFINLKGCLFLDDSLSCF